MDTPKSRALAENLAVTRMAEINYDPNALILLSHAQEIQGVGQRCKSFLNELYHPYLNPELALSLMRQAILGDLWFYLQEKRAGKLVPILLELYEKVVLLCQGIGPKKKAIQEYLDFIASASELWPLSEEHLQPVLGKLRQWTSQTPQLGIELCGSVRKCLLRFARSSKPAFYLAKELLLANLDFWRGHSGWEAWMQDTGRHCKIDGTKLKKCIGNEFYEYWKAALEKADELGEIEAIPDFTELSARYREAQNYFLDLTGRIQYIFYLLRLEGMSGLQDHLLWDLNRQLSGLLQALEPEAVLEMIESVFRELGDFWDDNRGIVLDCVLSLGKNLLDSENAAIEERFRQKYVSLGFTAPGRVSIGSDWQLETDKNHLKHLRASLALIAINPSRHKDLLSHLIISLTHQGIFVADTDLFQKDVSQFLNSDLKQLFVQAKHLLRMFPVFFNEIGAEGEIRDCTTALDELTNRKDLLLHFLRKQVHTESNNTQIHLIRQILLFWTDLNQKHLQGLIPEDVASYLEPPDAITKEQSAVLNRFLAEHNLNVDELLSLSWQKVEALFESLPDDLPHKRLKNLLETHFLLQDKYNLAPYDIVKFLARYSWFDTREQNRLRNSLIRKDYESSIRQMLGFIGTLNITVLDPKPSQGWENIYFKRHIAAGIPSMYGTYREAKLEAMGMIFRLENVIRRMFENSIDQLNLHYINGKTLHRIIRILELYDYAMQQERVTNDAFSTALKMLSSAVHLNNLSLGQYLDIFGLLKDSVNEIISEYYYRFYDKVLRSIEIRDSAKEARERFAEEFYRKLLSASFLVQGLDGFIMRIIQSLNQMKHIFAPEDISRVISYDPDKLFFHLHSRNSRIENQVLLGSKAYFLKRMYQYEFPIPPGFVITTELFRNRRIINTHPEISSEFDSLLSQNLARLEAHCGLGFGDPHKPLFLSVRSGAPMSLPGAMDTFLNIGMNDDITLRLAKLPNFGWTAWDCYRRLIQSWGMAFGIDRDCFDDVIISYKKRYKVEQKIHFTANQMQQMINDYKAVLATHQVHFEQDPFTQLYRAISHVLDSWNTERARSYRQKLHIADEWGTAVIVQKMVLGNISLDSGTGVLFTHAPWNQQPGICMNGDFTLCSQGEDLVAGLVHPLPISEAQRSLNPSPSELSLEKDFPAIYQRLLRYVSHLIQDKNYPHQEMEFTFEGSSEDQLFILQTRDQVIYKSPDYQVPAIPDQLGCPLGTGIGIGKGAINGIIVISREDIKLYGESGQAMILVRPDTVPDDMDMLFDCQALLTSRGGVTSHAAVTATRLGLIGVVNCRELMVNDREQQCLIGSLLLKPGSQIMLDATSGAVYAGHHSLQSVHSLK